MIEAKLSGADLLERLRRELRPALARGIGASGERLVDRLAAAVPQKTGAMAASFRVERLEQSSSGARVSVVSDDPGAARLDQGGTISGESHKLAVPLSSAAVPADATPLDYPDLVPIPSRTGDTILAQLGPEGEVSPMFVLKDQITIHPLGYLDKVTQATEAEALDLIVAAIGSAAERLS